VQGIKTTFWSVVRPLGNWNNLSLSLRDDDDDFFHEQQRRFCDDDDENANECENQQRHFTHFF